MHPRLTGCSEEIKEGFSDLIDMVTIHLEPYCVEGCEHFGDRYSDTYKCTQDVLATIENFQLLSGEKQWEFCR